MIQLLLRKEGLQRHQFHSPTLFSDWLRLNLLVQFGGIWMDASILLNSPIYLQNMHADSEGIEITGFYNTVFQSNPKFPVLESWLLMTPPRSPFVTEWLRQFNFALRVGIDTYLKHLHIDTQYIYLFGGPYLAIHLCAQQVIQSRAAPIHSYARLRNVSSMDGPMELHKQCGFFGLKFWCMGDALAHPSIKSFAIVKLTKSNRKWMEWSEQVQTVLGEHALTKLMACILGFLYFLAIVRLISR